jgi:hypothetical protein
MAAPAYDGLQYGSLSLRANQHLQSRRAEHRYCRWAVRSLTLGGVKLPLPFTTRMTVVRLSNGDLFLHSPIKFDGRLANELLGLGAFHHLVSPNLGGGTGFGAGTRDHGGFGELDGCLNARRFLLATGGGRGCAIAAIDCGSDQQLR